MKKKLFLLLSSIFISIISFAFSEKNIQVYSRSMKKNISVTVVLPDSYSTQKKYSTIYVLHGWSGNNRDYPDKTSLNKLADKYDVIYIAPDGNYDSWYVDSKVKNNSNYYTFVSKELVEYIDKNYSTKTEKEQRAITGLSMGGFGALYIGIKNQNIFGNIGSMSGGVNVEEYKDNWGIKKVITGNWDEYNIKNIAPTLIGSKTNIIFDCGVDDFFIEPNRELHKKLLNLNINHVYTERPGGHTWEYWDESIDYHSYFFSKNFNK